MTVKSGSRQTGNKHLFRLWVSRARVRSEQSASNPAELEAIGDDPEKFKAFVNAAKRKNRARA